mgnify:CR=1 FL=1
MIFLKGSFALLLQQARTPAYPDYFQSLLITRSKTNPLTTNTAPINSAALVRPYKMLPTVNKAAQMVMLPATQPIKAIGRLSAF